MHDKGDFLGLWDGCGLTIYDVDALRECFSACAKVVAIEVVDTAVLRVGFVE